MADLAEELYKFNLWWEAPFKPQLIPRQSYLEFLRKNLGNRDIILITGIRRVGKTSLIKLLIQELLLSVEPRFIFYLSLDSLALEPFSISELIREYRKIHQLAIDHKVYLFFDEVANRPHVHQELKNLYDSENVKIFASSSSTSILRDSKAFLTGRARIMEVLPLNFNEFLDFKGYQPKTAEKYLLESHFEQYMQMGGIPEYVLTEDISYLDNLIEDIIYKDIVAYHAVRDVAGIKNLFRLLMERCGKQVSINKISKVIGIVPDTVRRYIDYFMQTFLIYTVERCGKLNERIRSPKKLYAADVGIRNHITGFRDKGAVFENLVFLRIKHHSPCYIYQDGIELDFYCNDTLLEVKYNRELESKQQNLYENFQARRKMLIDSLEDYLKLE